MYFEKLRIPPQSLWRVLTLASLMLLVYQHGPCWIHYLHKQSISQTKIQSWILMQEILTQEPERFAEELEICRIWLSVHGCENADANSMKDLWQKWTDILSYWQGYKQV
ncbi:MAG: hypothetical protein AAF696_25845 [Bacteroidota bacterium]